MRFENNPLTTVFSIVCNHVKQFEGHCIRGIKDVPVHYSVIENSISTTCAKQMVNSPAPFIGLRVAVVGAHSGGLCLADGADGGEISPVLQNNTIRKRAAAHHGAAARFFLSNTYLISIQAT